MKTSVLKQVSEDFQSISRKLENYSSEIASVNRALQVIKFNRPVILNNIKKSSSSVNEMAYKTKLIKNYAIIAADRYAKAEKKVNDINKDKQFDWLKFTNKWTEKLSKLFNGKGGVLGLFGSVAGLIGELSGEIPVSGLWGLGLGFCKSGTKVTSKIFDYIKKKRLSGDEYNKGINESLYDDLHPNFLKIGGFLTIAGDVFGIGKTVADYIFSDDKKDKKFDFIGDMVVEGIKTVGDCVKVAKYSDKFVKYASNGASQYVLREGAKKTIAKVNAFVTVAELAWGGIKGGYNEYKELSKDGKISGADVGKIATHAVSGIVTEGLSTVSFGLIKLDTKKVGDYAFDFITGKKSINDVRADVVSGVSDITNKATSFVKNSWSAITKFIT